MVKPQEYEIIDNGGRPFLVKIYKSRIEVYGNYEENFGELLLEIKNYEKVFLGKNTGPDPHYIYEKGNNILVKTGKCKYIIIGMEIREFSTAEEILDFESPIGNSGVPTPTGIGEKYSYMLGDDMMAIPNLILPKINPHPWDNYIEIFYNEPALAKFLEKQYALKYKVLVRRQD